jgi:hypothetical protein
MRNTFSLLFVLLFAAVARAQPVLPVTEFSIEWLKAQSAPQASLLLGKPSQVMVWEDFEGRPFQNLVPNNGATPAYYSKSGHPIFVAGEGSTNTYISNGVWFCDVDALPIARLGNVPWWTFITNNGAPWISGVRYRWTDRTGDADTGIGVHGGVQYTWAGCTPTLVHTWHNTWHLAQPGGYPHSWNLQYYHVGGTENATASDVTGPVGYWTSNDWHIIEFGNLGNGLIYVGIDGWKTNFYGKHCFAEGGTNIAWKLNHMTNAVGGGPGGRLEIDAFWVREPDTVGVNQIMVGTNCTLVGTTAVTVDRPYVAGTNNGVFWASNNTLWWVYTLGGTSTNWTKLAGP